MAAILKSWKTSICGVLAFVMAGLVGTGKISSETAAVVSSTIVGIIGLIAKDADKTGV